MIHQENKTKKESATMNNNVKYLNPKADLTFKLVFGEHADQQSPPIPQISLERFEIPGCLNPGSSADDFI